VDEKCPPDVTRAGCKGGCPATRHCWGGAMRHGLLRCRSSGVLRSLFLMLACWRRSARSGAVGASHAAGRFAHLVVPPPISAIGLCRSLPPAQRMICERTRHAARSAVHVARYRAACRREQCVEACRLIGLSQLPRSCTIAMRGGGGGSAEPAISMPVRLRPLVPEGPRGVNTVRRTPQRWGAGKSHDRVRSA